MADKEAGPDAPLAGVRVVDFSRVLAGPLATMILGDLGADVIKVERPETGDDTRAWGPPFVGEDAAYFLSLNRNKRSIALDLQSPEGARVARALADTADVVVENFRPGLMTRFGLDHETLAGSNPGLVYCSLTAFGEQGESASRPGYDIIVQALSGLMSFTGQPGGEPTKVGVALLDVITGLYAANGIQAALLGRGATGRGTRVTVSLFDASVAALVNQAANFLLGGVVPGPMGNAHPNIVPYQLFATADRPFILAAGNDRLYRRTCEVIARPELADDERFATNEARVRNRDELIPLLQEAFLERPSSEWLLALEGAAVPCAPVRKIDEVFASPEGAATVQEVDDPVRGMLRLVADPIRVSGAAAPVRLPPPRLGEHTDEILRELGTSPAMGAVEAWGEMLRGWGVPEEILAKAPESPWGIPAELMRHRAELAVTHQQLSASAARAMEALPKGGTVIDVGVGGGAASLPLASRASRITGVDSSEGMLAEFRGAAAAAGVEAVAVLGSWLDVASDVEPADVVVCNHVLYNTSDLGPFVAALTDHARRRVVLEITERHPLSWMSDLWLRFHGLERPSGPTASDAFAALEELGVGVHRQDRTREASPSGFERREDAVALARRRLCLRAERDAEIAEALGERLAERDALWSAGPVDQVLVTLWWDTA